MTLPARVQLSRRKGFRLQEHAPGAIVVRRPTQWGNPFIVAVEQRIDPTLTVLQARERCTRLFDLWLDGDVELVSPAYHVEQRAWILANLERLRGHPLACTCPLPAVGAIDHCHARVLIERSNRPAAVEPWSDYLDVPPLDKWHGLTHTVTPSGEWAGAL